MKYIIGVLASDNIQAYTDMKNIWIQNVLKHNFPDVYVYFIYSKSISTSVTFETKQLAGNVYDFTFNHVESIENLKFKAMGFINYVNDTFSDYMLLRTNISTLFNLPMTRHFLSFAAMYKNFFAGTFLMLQDGIAMSGTNNIMSPDMVKVCVMNSDRVFQGSILEDVEISKSVTCNFKSISTYNIRRIDLVDQQRLELQNCNRNNLNNVFCYRFKSENRDNDVENMRKIFESNYDAQVIFNLLDTMQVVEHTPVGPQEFFQLAC